MIIKLKYWVILSSLFLFSLSGCFEYEDIDFKGVENISIAERTDSNLKLKVAVRVDNPNKFNIKVKKSTLDIYLNGKYVGKATSDNKVVLRKKTEDVYDVYLSTNPKDIMKAAMGSLGNILGGKAKIRLKGKIKGSVYGITRGVDVDMEETINLKDLM